MDVKKKRTLLTFCVMKRKCLLAYVTDIFGKLNKLHAIMQGKYENIPLPIKYSPTTRLTQTLYI